MILSIMLHYTVEGCGGGLVVGILDLNFDDLNSNPSYNWSPTKVFLMTRNKQNQAENSPFLKWAGQLKKFEKFLLCIFQIMARRMQIVIKHFCWRLLLYVESQFSLIALPSWYLSPTPTGSQSGSSNGSLLLSDPWTVTSIVRLNTLLILAWITSTSIGMLAMKSVY